MWALVLAGSKVAALMAQALELGAAPARGSVQAKAEATGVEPAQGWERELAPGRAKAVGALRK